MRIAARFFLPVGCLRRCLTLSPLASYFSLQGQRKVTKRKALCAQEQTLYRCGQSRFSDSPSMARSENGARPARRPPGLDAHGNLEIINGKSRSVLRVGVAAERWGLTLKMRVAPQWLTTRRAAPMDGRRFWSSHGWRVRKWSIYSPSEVSPDRGSALSFGYFSLGACKEK